MLEVKEIVFGIEKCRTIKKEKHVVRLIIGKYGKNGDAIETVVVKEPRIRKKRELPSKTEVLYMAIAVLGFALSMASFCIVQESNMFRLTGISWRMKLIWKILKVQWKIR